MTNYRVERVPGDGCLADAFDVRRAVFIEEQDVPEALEMDGKDEGAIHFVILTADEEPVGTVRLRIPESGVGKIERVAVKKPYRGEELGHRLMGLIESEARSRDCDRAVLHAQTRVVPFYEAIGYEVTSGEFDDAGIPHVEMQKPL